MKAGFQPERRSLLASKHWDMALKDVEWGRLSVAQFVKGK